jgi:hypothetical protein
MTRFLLHLYGETLGWSLIRRKRALICAGRDFEVAIPRRRERTWRTVCRCVVGTGTQFQGSELLSMYWLSFERDSRAAPRPARRMTNKSLYPNSDPACRSTVQFPLRSELSESHHNQVSPDLYLFPPRLSSVFEVRLTDRNKLRC